ncbi:hydrantoinase/dihydropyrimidinase family member [Anaeramoeba ignava]|uniref:dihydropyrimidinase n=1 Tax=Anaeramoeba ignava TaxID=1746090 RepID=A0A9Q0RC12_ANAIG|nr:hydrantoinase/dihydropyrimidinase family member [Anaeramoeba ignava]KAJ5078668.1 hydrantoinase/dihydropyrimidinase family member [Anaeramoeba ignava]
MSKILLKKGTIINADEEIPDVDVLIDNGIIVKVDKEIKVEENVKVIDCTGKYLLPGGIDPHTHMQMPFGGTYAKDDYPNGTKMAIIGGSTLLIDFICPSKSNPSLVDAYKTWMEWATDRIHCDVSHHMCVVAYNEQIGKELEICVKDYGINSFKHFLAYKGILQLEDSYLFQSFKRCAELGALCQVHAENGDLVVEGCNNMVERGIMGPEAHALSRPSYLEGEATNRALMIARLANAPLYVVHVSCKEASDAIMRAKQDGQVCFGESLATHLSKDDSAYWDKDFDVAAAHVMSPPFRPKLHQKALWQHIQNGVISTTGTDHCVFDYKQKRMGFNDFRKIPNGCGGIEDRPSVLWQLGVNSGKISRRDFVAITSTNAAKIFNVFPQKGVIREGADADIAIWDPKATRVISGKTHHSYIEYNMFEGMEITGVPIMTISRGVIACEHQFVDGKIDWKNPKINVDTKHGRIVKRKPFSPYVYSRSIYIPDPEIKQTKRD